MDPLEGARGVAVSVGGRRLVAFAGCDYLGLARHPRVVAAARRALDQFGAGASASRTTTGTTEPHVRLEGSLARWLGAPDAVATASGFLAGAVAVRALSRTCGGVLLDAGAHPALARAAEGSGLCVKTYARFDADSLRRALAAARWRRPMVLTDSLDLTTGARAPVRALLAAARARGGVLVLDDAHGVGALGPRGRGASDGVKLPGPGFVLAGTLAKALGAHGGFVAASAGICRAAREAAEYAGATPVPPSVAAAAAEAARIAAGPEGARLRRRLAENVKTLTRAWIGLGFPPPASDAPWLSERARAGESASAASRRLARWSRDLAARGFLVPHVSYFGAAPGGILRVSVSALHRPEHLSGLTRALAELRG
jgi:8-amino-7-oxononanoate synthase